MSAQRKTIAGYRRLSIAEKSRVLRPVAWLFKCMKCGVKVTARDQRSHAERHGVSCYWAPDKRTCTRCGRDWWTFIGCTLTTHARCRFSFDEADAILERYTSEPGLTIARLAVDLDVTENVLRVVLDDARRRQNRGAWRCRLCGERVPSRYQAGHTARAHAGASHGWDMVTS